MTPVHIGRFFAALLLPSAVWVGACIEGSGGRPRGERCDSAGDCAEGLRCEYGRCRGECLFDRDCPDGTACVASELDPDLRVCTFVDEGGCSTNPCPEGLECGEDGLCRDPCVGVECPGGRLCEGGVCVEGPGAADGDADADVDADADMDTDADSDADGGEPSWPDRFILDTDLVGEDGFDDLVVVSSGGAGALHFFAGGPGFEAACADEAEATVSGSPDCILGGRPFLTDENGDGNADVLACLRCEGQGYSLAVIHGPVEAGERTVEHYDRRIVLPSDLPTCPDSAAVADLVGDDGRPDLALGFTLGISGVLDGSPGLVHVYSDLPDLADLPEATPATVIVGSFDGDYLGRLESAPADVTGNGSADLLLGSPRNQFPDGVRSGAAYLFEGPLPTRAEPFLPEDIAVVTLRGTTDREWTGSGVAIVDANHDGVLDLAVAVDEDDHVVSNAGRIYFLAGPITTLDSYLFSTGVPLLHGLRNYELGTTLAGHVDLDGDGWPDLLVGVHDGPSGGGSVVGLLTSTSPVEIAYEDAYFSWARPDTGEPSDRSGIVNAAVVGDLDGDGRQDIAIGQPGMDGAAGEVLVFLGEGGFPSGVASEEADLHIGGDCAALEGFGAFVLAR